MKAVRGIELKLDTLNLPKLKAKTDEEIVALLHQTATTSGCLWCTRPSNGAFPSRKSTRSPGSTSGFLAKLQNLAQMEEALCRRAR